MRRSRSWPWHCTEQHGPEVGTNTNWLQRCETPSECGDALDCVCGVCTRSCSQSATCSDIGEDAVCETLATQSCAGAPSMACVAECSVDDDCLAIADAECSGGRCVVPEVMTEDAPVPSDAAVPERRRQAGQHAGRRRPDRQLRPRPIYPSLFDCQNSGLTCFRLPESNMSCGLCNEALDCTTVDCSPGAVSQTTCPAGVEWEGTCGSVRYRRHMLGFVVTDRFWDDKTGEVLALATYNDVPAFCGSTSTVGIVGDLAVAIGCKVVTDSSTVLTCR